MSRNNSNLKARYWLLTIPHADFLPYLPPTAEWIRGQLELSHSSYLHWQLIVGFNSQQRLSALKKLFGQTAHCEPTRSDAADEYVWKDDTAVVGTRFELGRKSLKRNCSKDWDAIKESAKQGRLDDIPSDVYVRSYSALRRIAVDNAQPVALERTVMVYWGPTGVGKSRRAWSEAGLDAYPKDPRSKFWDGYRDHKHVVLDEFRGGIDISHILRWFDRYPVLVEIKGSSAVLRAEKIWITSNIPPEQWYPELDRPTLDALIRRLNIVHISEPLTFN